MKTFLRLKNYLLNKNKNKLVYRFISEQEKTSIENKDFSQIGGFWHNIDAGNTHNYKKGIKYLHFFDKKEDALTLYREFGKSKQYFCTYSIPNKILKKYIGKGFYIPVGYEVRETIREYAIPVTEFDANWIVSISPSEVFLKDSNNIKI